MKKRILSMMLCCFMLFGMIFIVSADSTTPDHTRAGYDVVWFESFEDLEPGGKICPQGGARPLKPKQTSMPPTLQQRQRITVEIIFVYITNPRQLNLKTAESKPGWSRTPYYCPTLSSKQTKSTSSRLKPGIF